MLRWLCALVAGGIVTGFAFLLVTGEYRNEGRVLFTVSRNHGLHAGDLFVLAGWAVAVLALLALATMPRAAPGRRGPGPPLHTAVSTGALPVGPDAAAGPVSGPSTGGRATVCAGSPAP